MVTSNSAPQQQQYAPPPVDSKPSPPNLASGIEWQSNCRNCSGLVWTSVGYSPWNKYYQVSCVNDMGIESDRSSVYGPAADNNFNNPKVRVQLDGVNACGNNKLRVYRGELNNLQLIKPMNFGANGEYNGTDAIFTDK
jgi:hypothetical protein